MPGYLRERDLETVLSLSLWSRVVQVQEGEEPGPEQSRACLPLLGKPLTASLKSMGCKSLGAPLAAFSGNDKSGRGTRPSRAGVSRKLSTVSV